jgi:hypothetical protein
VDWTPPWPDAHLGQIAWFPGGHAAVALIQTARDAGGNKARVHVIQLDGAASGGLDRVTLDDSAYMAADVSPARTTILLVEGSERTERFRLMTPDAISDPIDVPDDLTVPTGSADGSNPVFLGFAPGGKRSYAVFDLDEYTWKRLAARPHMYTPPLPPFRVARSSSQVRIGDGRAALTHPLWIVSGKGEDSVSELLCADGEGAEADRQGDAVLYRSNGLAFIREVAAVSRPAYLAQQKDADTAKAKEDARHIGLAMRMYADDYDSAFPAGAGGMTAFLSYLGDGDALLGPGGLPGFQYTFGGGPLDPGAGQGSTVLGYTSAPGGRFDVYADGHVQWVPKP